MRGAGGWGGWILGGVWLLQVSGATTADAAAEKRRLVHVDSYHREYAGSWSLIEGLNAGLIRFGYLDDETQARQLDAQDAVESSTTVVKRIWMDSKRKDSKSELIEATVRITEQIRAFQPMLLFLSDDNAANYLGNQFLDTEIPVVFSRVKNTPVKYGLVDAPEQPGHNVTGIYAVGFYRECLELLKRLVPSARTFAILSDEHETGRSHIKGMEHVAREPDSPLERVETVTTRSFETWQRKALELQGRVDAFYLASMNSLEDAEGRDVPREEALRWYLTHIRIPETIHAISYVEQGLFCAADFSSYNMGFDAVEMAHEILHHGRNPATYPVRAGRRGPLVVNRQRAAMLGMTLTPEMGIEQVIERASLLAEPDQAPATP